MSQDLIAHSVDTRPPLQNGLRWAAFMAAFAVLTGCAVTPQPFTDDDRRASLQRDRSQMFERQQALSGPLTLDEAIARALKFNLDHRVKLMEESLAQRQLDLSRTDLLPKLVAQAGYGNRDNVLASSSQDIVTGVQSLVPSTSTDRERITADLGLSWNILDFGVSYYTAQQNADRYLIAQERRRKVLHLLIQQTRQAYWQAVGAQILEDRIDPTLELARKALANSRRVETERLRSPLEALSYQRQLLDIIRQLEAVRDELHQARPRLASLMNLTPGQDFRLVVPSALPTMPKVTLSVDEMEEAALLGRPELVEAQYQERISVLETRKALARLLPGVELSFGGHHDSNSFLVNNRWWDAGLRVSWNLLNLFNAKTIRGVAEAQQEIAKQQRLALSMAVLTQVHVARLDYQAKARQFETLKELGDVEQRILTQTRSGTNANIAGQLEEVRAAATAMMSQLRLYQGYGALQGSYAQLAASLGLDPLPESLETHELADLSQAVQSAEAQWAQRISP